MHKNNDMLGKILKDARESAEISISVLSQKIGVSKRYLYEIEAGKKKPSFDVLYRLVRELYISSDLIFYPEKLSKNSEVENLIRMLSVCDEDELELVSETVKALLL